MRRAASISATQARRSTRQLSSAAMPAQRARIRVSSIRIEILTMLRISLYIHISVENFPHIQSKNYSYGSDELHACIALARA
jgi:hypothetical protein